VVVGAETARALGGDLDVLLVKKLRAPGNPELALGAVGEDGRVYINREVAGLIGPTDAYLPAEIAERQAEMAAQQRRYRSVRPRVSPSDRTVILVDDGLATGATMIAGIEATARARPSRLVVAVPVSPPEVARKIEALEPVSEFVCLETPWDFQGVGQFYEDFMQVDDETVAEILKQFA
jgi:predicted phosphoribosyltransferase